MNLPESTKINILRGGSLALVLLFFFAPLVRWSSWHWSNQWNNPVRFTISGWEYAIGAGTIQSRPLIFVLLILPVVLFGMSWVKKSYEILATISIAGVVAQIVFIFWFRSLDMFQRNFFEFSGFTWLIIAVYVGLSAFSLYCVKQQGKVPIQAVSGVLKTAMNSISNIASSAASPNAVCSNCNSPLDLGSAFCKNCGQKASMPTPQPIACVPTAQSQLTCTNCGEMLEPGDKFCEGCGQQVTGGASPALLPSRIPTSPPPMVNAASVPPSYTSPPPVRPVQAAHTPPPPIQPMANQPRMPLVFLLDTSATSAPFINQLSSGLNRFKTDVCRDRRTQDILDVSVIQFSDSTQVLQHYSPVGDMRPLRLISGGQPLFSNSIRETLRMTEGYTLSKPNSYKPWVILITCGGPIDDITAIANEVQNLQSADKLRLMALGTQGSNTTALKSLTDVVFKQDGDDFMPFFDWIGKCMWAIAQTSPGEKPKLPQLEGNVYREK